MATISTQRSTIRRTFSIVAMVAVLGLISSCSETPMQPSPELQALMDRAAIEDLFNNYYSEFGPDSRHDFTAYFADNGILEVNGLVADSREKIAALYAQAGVGGETEAPKAEDVVPEGVSEMMFSNLKIDLQGNSAGATLLWFSIKSDLLTSAPKVTEYGRERTELVKQDGQWRISRRVVLSEGGMPEGLLDSYPKP